MGAASGPPPESEPVLWEAYPSWGQFAWLYLMAGLSGARGLLFWRFQAAGGEVWLGGAAALLVCAAVLRRWAKYTLTSTRLVVRNGYTGRVIHAIELERIGDISVKQGPVADTLGIGTVVVRAAGEDRVIRLRGIKEPEFVKDRLERARRAGGGAVHVHEP